MDTFPAVQVRILHVGLGARGRDWLGFVKAFPAATTVACVEPDPQALAKARAGLDPGVRCFASLDQALDEAHGAVEADAALIASPSALHAEQALAALDAGLAVLIEKPFAPDVAAARSVIERAAAVGRPLVVAENFRFVPVERTVRRVLRSELGPLSNIQLCDRRRMPPAMHGGFVRGMMHPQLRELAVHHFDSLRSFTGRKPLAVTARCFNPPGSEYAHGACTEALLEFEGDLHVQYLGTMTANKFGWRLYAEGQGGDLWSNRKLVALRRRGKRFFLPVKREAGLPGDADPYPREGTTSLLESLRAALAGVEPESSGRENIWAIAMVQAAVVSDVERRTVSIDEVYREP
jgi:predicted dehydrogenase